MSRSNAVLTPYALSPFDWRLIRCALNHTRHRADQQLTPSAPDRAFSAAWHCTRLTRDEIDRLLAVIPTGEE